MTYVLRMHWVWCEINILNILIFNFEFEMKTIFIDAYVKHKWFSLLTFVDCVINVHFEHIHQENSHIFSIDNAYVDHIRNVSYFHQKKNSINSNDSNFERNSFTLSTFCRRQCICWIHDLCMLILCFTKFFIKKRKKKVVSKRFNKIERRFFNLNMFCLRFFFV